MSERVMRYTWTKRDSEWIKAWLSGKVDGPGWTPLHDIKGDQPMPKEEK